MNNLKTKKNMKNMENYWIKYYNEAGEPASTTRKTLVLAREFSKECFRNKTFIELTNKNGTVLPI